MVQTVSVESVYIPFGRGKIGGGEVV